MRQHLRRCHGIWCGEKGTPQCRHGVAAAEAGSAILAVRSTAVRGMRSWRASSGCGLDCVDYGLRHWTALDCVDWTVARRKTATLAPPRGRAESTHESIELQVQNILDSVWHFFKAGFISQ